MIDKVRQKFIDDPVNAPLELWEVSVYGEHEFIPELQNFLPIEKYKVLQVEIVNKGDWVEPETERGDFDYHMEKLKDTEYRLSQKSRYSSHYTLEADIGLCRRLWTEKHFTYESANKVRRIFFEVSKKSYEYAKAGRGGGLSSNEYIRSFDGYLDECFIPALMLYENELRELLDDRDL